MTGAELFVQCLETGGIDTVFALPGEETGDLMDALASSDIEIVLCRHEQSAAYMASVHGRLTGRPAACLATLGPGATNLLTGVADAMLDAVPLVAITGQGARGRIGRGRHSHQMIDLARLFEPVTKLSRTLRSGAEIAEGVAEALNRARTATPGAVHLSLPEDLAGADVPDSPVRSVETLTPSFNPDAMAAAVTRIADSRQPIILAGAGVFRAGAVDALRDFARATGMPLATSFMAKGVLSGDDPQDLGAFGLPRADHVDRAIARSDLIVAVGLDPVEYPFEKLTDAGRVPLVALSAGVVPRDTGAEIAAEVLGDLKATLSAAARALEARRWSVWPAAETARKALRDDLAPDPDAMAAMPPGAAALVAAVEQSVTAEDTVLSGVGTHKLALARNFRPTRAGQILIANGLAGMGLALPGAMAAARLQRAGRVIAICGDGDVMMNVQDMETAARLDLSLTVVVWVDGGFGLIEDKQEDETGTRPDLSFDGIGWGDLARAFGWSHTACDTAEDLRGMLVPSDAAPARHLITVPVRYEGSFA